MVCQDMKSAQARASVETLREVQNDKSLKTKAEKERRLREAPSQISYTVISQISYSAISQISYSAISQIRYSVISQISYSDLRQIS
jgi:hypothetical protein